MDAFHERVDASPQSMLMFPSSIRDSPWLQQQNLPSMPAMLDDPNNPPIYRRSGEPPYPGPNAGVPDGISPRQVTLRDRMSVATIMPFSSHTQIPLSLLSYLCQLLNKEIDGGDTYPMLDTFPLEKFGPYWFANFAAIMIKGDLASVEQKLASDRDEGGWEKDCLGSFYVKPNYPGRSSHVCNAGFIVGLAARNQGVGKVMGQTYVEWAPKLGYSYSVFNLVYETNVASCRIWDSLGFKRIGRVKGCGNLRSYPGQLIDAIIYGRELGVEEDEDVFSEERFDKIRYYLKHGKYPNGADRAEKSRLRSAATHYRLVEDDESEGGEKLMLKDKEVVADPARQYEIAAQIHTQHHGGINKTTATIAEKFHWVRIKETVSLVIKNCPDCKDFSAAKTPAQLPSAPTSSTQQQQQQQQESEQDTNKFLAGVGAAAMLQQEQHLSVSAAGRYLSLPDHTATDFAVDPQLIQYMRDDDMVVDLGDYRHAGVAAPPAATVGGAGGDFDERIYA